jgi:hypothetical protein
MSNSSGRCFRARRGTARRKARQARAFADLRRQFPDAHFTVGSRRHDLTLEAMSPGARQEMMNQWLGRKQSGTIPRPTPGTAPGTS